MPLPLIRYTLDPTGRNPDNLVVAEVHTLNSSQVRAVAPTEGGYFTESLVVYDHSTNRLLVRGVDYQCAEMMQEPSLRFGKEISLLVLILDHTVSSQVRINYQVLGGLYQNNAANIVNMYNAVMNDERPVDWINVLNKPPEYPPTLHNHLLSDVYGFEAVVAALERIRNSIVLSDVPAFEALIEWVKRRTLPVVSEEEIHNVIPVNKIVTFERMIFALKELNFNAITIEPTIATFDNNSNVTFNLTSTKLDDNTVLYWTIEHITTTDADFNILSGPINITGNRGSFNVSISDSLVQEFQEKFRIIIRKNSPEGPELARTSNLTIQGIVTFINDIMKYMLACCFISPMIERNPVSMFIIGPDDCNH